MFASYVTVPVYAEFFRWLGHGDEIADMCAAWEARDREAATAAAPWGLIEQTFVLGTPEQMRARLGEFVDGGVTLPVLLPITTPDRMGELIDALAPGS
jgi:alkanesulfonate monooxygenase SsuD/methylene tetrahydromethanopterin reductase-like flavin-dependent oxidoreductase (luciferase family)